MERARGKTEEERQTRPYHTGTGLHAVTVKGGHTVTSHKPDHNTESLRDALKDRAHTGTLADLLTATTGR